MPPSRPRKKKIPFEFSSGAPKGEPTKQVSKLHHELRTLQNEKFELQNKLNLLTFEHTGAIAKLQVAMEKAHAYITTQKALPVSAFLALERTPFGRVMEMGAVSCVNEILVWFRESTAASEAFVAAGKAGA